MNMDMNILAHMNTKCEGAPRKFKDISKYNINWKIARAIIYVSNPTHEIRAKQNINISLPQLSRRFDNYSAQLLYSTETKTMLIDLNLLAYKIMLATNNKYLLWFIRKSYLLFFAGQI